MGARREKRNRMPVSGLCSAGPGGRQLRGEDGKTVRAKTRLRRKGGIRANAGPGARCAQKEPLMPAVQSEA